MTWSRTPRRSSRRARRVSRRFGGGSDAPQHPVDLGRLYVSEGNTTLAAHKLFEMERRGRR